MRLTISSEIDFFFFNLWALRGCQKAFVEGPVYEQRRVDLATFRAVPVSTWGHCPQVLWLAIVCDTPEKEKIAKWSSAPASILEGFN